LADAVFAAVTAVEVVVVAADGLVAAFAMAAVPTASTRTPPVVAAQRRARTVLDLITMDLLCRRCLGDEVPTTLAAPRKRSIKRA
jgi:hypothetical protein